MNVREVTVKVGRKVGQPNFGSTTEEVTLTASLDAGEKPEDAVAVLRDRAQAILDKKVGAKPEPERVRITAEQRRDLVALMEKAKPQLQKAKFGSPLALAHDRASKVQFADEAEPAAKALRAALFDLGVKP